MAPPLYESVSGTSGVLSRSSRSTQGHARLSLPATLPRSFLKVAALVENDLCDTYLLFTNKTVTAGVEAKVTTSLADVGVTRSVVTGRDELIRRLTEDKDLRGLMPRVYGLGDLSEILDERLYAQTKALVYEGDISRFVPTDPYVRTLSALDDYGFALVLGEPASGKSSIMRAAAIFAADKWGLEPLWLSSIGELATHWNATRTDQLFLLDDAFGSTNFDPDRTDDWNRSIVRMRTAIARGARFILTSRDYVYAAARPALKRHELPVVNDGEVVINVERLSPADRRQLVYNHLRLGDQPKAFRSAIKPHLWRLTVSPRLTPETARRLGDARFTEGLDPSSLGALLQFVEEPRDHLLRVIEGLSNRLQAAILSLVAMGGEIESPLPESSTIDAIADRLVVGRHDIAQALEEMDGSLVRLHQDAEQRIWRVRHPTIVESMSDWLLAHPDLIDLYARHAPLQSVRSQTVCDARVVGAVQLPKQLWSTIFDRMIDTDGATEIALRYFASRCSSSALRGATRLADIEALLDRREFTSPLDGDPKMRLFQRLAVDGQVSPDNTRRMLDEAVAQAVHDFDAYVLSNPVLEQLAVAYQPDMDYWPSVVARFMERVRSDLTSHVDEIVDRYDSLVDRLDAVTGTVALLDVLEDWVGDDELRAHASEQRARLSEWATDDDGPPPHLDAHARLLEAVFGIRPDVEDVFSDVDA